MPSDPASAAAAAAAPAALSLSHESRSRLAHGFGAGSQWAATAVGQLGIPAGSYGRRVPAAVLSKPAAAPAAHPGPPGAAAGRRGMSGPGHRDHFDFLETSAMLNRPDTAQVIWLTLWLI